jgi:hypothetical protein
MIDGQATYACLDCRDSGIVVVFSPEFVIDYRDYFEQENGVLPDGWYGVAYSWWRAKEQGPMVHVALCDCRSPRAIRLRAQLAIWNEDKGKRPKEQRRRTPPACGLYAWNRSDTPRIPSTLLAREALTTFYRERLIH